MAGRRPFATFPACLILAAAIAGCGGEGAPASPSGLATGDSSAASAALIPPTDLPPKPARNDTPHVFVIVMENSGLSTALRSRPIARLAAANALATNYSAVARPSLPNYLALTSGSTWGIADNGYHALPAADLGSQLTTAGISWRAAKRSTPTSRT